MLSAPFIGAITYCLWKKGKVLSIRQEKKKDARYFGKAFSEMVERKISSIEDNTIKLSKRETFVYGNKIKKDQNEIDEIVICRDDDFYAPKEVKAFYKEIYSEHNVVFSSENVVIRAAYAKEKMILADSTLVDRWVDAEETIAIYDNCDLGVSATAGKRLSIGMGCKFRRLYAPEIYIGQCPNDIKDPMESKNPYMLESAGEIEVVRNIKTVDRDMANERNEAKITVLTNKNLMILEDIILKGDICSDKGVRLCDGAVVCGNIFAEGDIHIGVNAVVLGNIFTQGSIFVEKNAMIGQPGKICSMIAREKISFEKDITVFGFVSCEGGGKVMEREEGKKHHYIFLPMETYRTEVYFDNLKEYEKVAEQGFRKEEFLKTVEIRVPAKSVPKSFCFDCKALENVTLPDTIEDIGAYAFADCSRLKTLTKFSCMKVKSIATSAFENCGELDELDFPKELEVLGGAAFAGCKNVNSITFARGSSLKIIGDHCFRGCEKVESISLPDTVEKIGISAFAGCNSLKYINIPARCEMEPGIVELKDNPDIVISYKKEEAQENLEQN